MIKRINKKIIIIFLSLITLLCCFFIISIFDNNKLKVNAERIVKSSDKSIYYDIDNNSFDSVNNTTTYKVCFDISDKSVNDTTINFIYSKKIVSSGETSQTFTLPIKLNTNLDTYSISFDSGLGSNIYYTDNHKIINYKFKIDDIENVFYVKLISYVDNVLKFSFTVPMLSDIQRSMVEYGDDKLVINIDDDVIVDNTIHKAYYNASPYLFELSYSYDINTDILTIYNSDNRYIWLYDKNDDSHYIGNSDILTVSCDDYDINNFSGLSLAIVCYVNDNSTNEGDEGYSEKTGISNCYTVSFNDDSVINYLPYVLKYYTKNNVNILSSCNRVFSYYSSETSEQVLENFISQSSLYKVASVSNDNINEIITTDNAKYTMNNVKYDGIVDNIHQFTCEYEIKYIYGVNLKETINNTENIYRCDMSNSGKYRTGYLSSIATTNVKYRNDCFIKIPSNVFDNTFNHNFESIKGKLYNYSLFCNKIKEMGKNSIDWFGNSALDNFKKYNTKDYYYFYLDETELNSYTEPIELSYKSQDKDDTSAITLNITYSVVNNNKVESKIETTTVSYNQLKQYSKDIDLIKSLISSDKLQYQINNKTYKINSVEKTNISETEINYKIIYVDKTPIININSGCSSVDSSSLGKYGAMAGVLCAVYIVYKIINNKRKGE